MSNMDWYGDARTQGLKSNLNNANDQNRSERARANQAEEAADLAKRQVDSKNQTINRFIEEIGEKNRRIAELTVLLEEWMLSQKVFKKLAQKYGEELGMEKDEVTQQYRGGIVEEHRMEPKEMTKSFVEEIKKEIKNNEK